MTHVEKQVSELRQIYRTKNIFNKSVKQFFTDGEVNKIIELLKEKKTDGGYDISEDIRLHLSNGKALILDNING